MHRSRASKRGRATCVRRARCHWSEAACRLGRRRPRACRPNGSPSVRRCRPADRSLPDRDVRDDLLLFDQPAKELARPVGRVGGKPLRLQTEALLRSIQHGLGCGNFIVGASRRRLDIHNHGVLDVDEVVQPIAKLHALVGLGGPCRLWVRRRDHLGRLALEGRRFAFGSSPAPSSAASTSAAVSASSAARYSATARF